MISPSQIHTIAAGARAGLGRYGVTFRALLLGTVLAPTLCAWTLYTEIVAQSTELAVMSLSVGVVFAMLVVLGVNTGLRRWLPRWALSQPELLFVYIMQTTSIAISGVGMMQFLNVGLANIFWYAGANSNWRASYQPLLRRWAFPDPVQLRGYYLGQSTFFTRAHMLAWLQPICVWTAFIVVLLFVMLCINSLLRRRWVDQERLTFPIAAIPLEMIRESAQNSLLKNRVFWFGFLLAFGLEALAGFAYLYPSLPFLPIKPSDPRLNLNSIPALQGLFNTPPWNAVGDISIGFYPMVIGLTYLLPLDVAFSCWFFFALRKLEDVGATAMGFRDPGASLALARIPYIGEQAGGAFLGLALFGLWSMRHYLKEVVGIALRPGNGEADRDEPMPYRWALLGTLGGFCVLVVFAMLLGMAARFAVALFALWFLVVIAYTRIRAEAGLPWAFGPDMTPHQMIAAAQGTQTMPMESMVALTQFQWLDLDYRCTIMPHQIEAMKIATETRMNQRHLVGAILIATVAATIGSWIGVLAIYYKFGAATAHVDEWRTSMGSSPWYLLDGWVNSPQKPDWTRLAGVLAGFVIVGLLMVARTRILWWPFHPVGYVLAGTFTMPWLWCPTLLGWLIKASILRYGGLRTYRVLLPFFIGLILGDYISGSLWAVLGCATGIQTYKVMPI
jgi:hypothetical protein